MLLCGAVLAVSAGMFTSCDDDDDYDTRISVLETALADLQAQINKALTVGASITNVAEENGTYVLTLSDGQVITIKPGNGGAGGGSDVTVTITDSEAVITINSTPYTLPLGSAVNSLIYSPEYADGEVLIADNTGAVVQFLARPALDNIDGAEFTIAESHELKSRVMGEENFKVSAAELKDGMVNLTVICINGDLAGQKHAAAVQMKYRGAVIGSNYFTIAVADDFSFSSEAIDANITVKGGTKLADGETYTVGVEPLALSNGEVDFAQMFENVPAGVEYRVASASKQPNGMAAEKRDMLAASLNKTTGKFDFIERPGTTFNVTAARAGEEASGFRVDVVKDEVTIAKTYVTVTDPFEGVNIGFGELQSQHMEYGVAKMDGDNHIEGDPLHLHKGENKLSLAEIMISGQLAIGHGDAWKFVEKLNNYSNDVVSVVGKNFVVDEEAAKYCKHSAGIKWFNMQTSVLSSNRRNWGMSEDEMKAIAGGECNGEIIGGWDGISGEDMAKYGISITPDGFIQTTAEFPGWGLRVGMGVEFEYDYGKLPISDGCLAYVFFGRRSLDEGVTDPAAR